MRKAMIAAALVCTPALALAGNLRGYETFSLAQAKERSRADGKPVLLYLTDSRS